MYLPEAGMTPKLLRLPFYRHLSFRVSAGSVPDAKPGQLMLDHDKLDVILGVRLYAHAPDLESPIG